MMKIEILTGDNCPKCSELKFKLESKGIEFTEIDYLSEYGVSLLRDNKIRSIPQILVDGLLVDKKDFAGLEGINID